MNKLWRTLEYSPPPPPPPHHVGMTPAWCVPRCIMWKPHACAHAPGAIVECQTRVICHAVITYHIATFTLPPPFLSPIILPYLPPPPLAPLALVRSRPRMIIAFDYDQHRLNMELNLQSWIGLLCKAVLIGWDPATPPSRRIWAHIRGRYWSAKIRRLLLVNPWWSAYNSFLCSAKKKQTYHSARTEKSVHSFLVVLRGETIFLEWLTHLDCARLYSDSSCLQTQEWDKQISLFWKTGISFLVLLWI